MYGRRYMENNEEGKRYERDCEEGRESRSMQSGRGFYGDEDMRHEFHEHMHQHGGCRNEEHRCRHEQHHGCHGRY